MFDKFYNLTGLPFLLTPDTRFYFGSEGHSRAIAHLVYGLSQQEGFIVITGEVGAGKTTLTEQLCSQLDRNTYVIARVVTTQVSGDDLLRLAMANFGLGDTPGTEKSTLLRRFEHMVRDQRRQGRRCLLVIDEVQNLSLAAMEELRMLSNITVDGRASLQTVLLGQPQFRPILASQDWEQLRQRVLASTHLGPLTEPETGSTSNIACAPSIGATTRLGTQLRSPPSIATPAASRAGSTRCVPGCCCSPRWNKPTR